MAGAKPEVSVLLPVYNGAATIGRAIESVLSQTFGDLELIVVDDGSTDGTADVLALVGDPRMRVVRHGRNRGLVAALHTGMENARAPLVARLDADDEATPERIAHQVRVMASAPRVGLLAGARRKRSWDGTPLGTGRPPRTHAAIWLRLHFGNCLGHSTVMFRRSVYDAVGGYRQAWYPAEDYDLWLRMAAVTQVASLADVLAIVNKRPDGISASNQDRQSSVVAARSRAAITEAIEWSPDPSTIDRLLGEQRGSTCTEIVASLEVVRRTRDSVARSCRRRDIAVTGIDQVAAAICARVGVVDAAGRPCWRGIALLGTRPLVAARVARSLVAHDGR